MKNDKFSYIWERELAWKEHFNLQTAKKSINTALEKGCPQRTAAPLSPGEERREERAWVLPTDNNMHFSVDTKTAAQIRENGRLIRFGMVSIRYLIHDSYIYSPVVSKRQGSAVERNRVKRVIRDIMQKGTGRYPEAAYLVFFNGPCSSLNREILTKDIDLLMKNME